MTDEKLNEWNIQLEEALSRKDVAAALEIKGLIEARLAQLVEDAST